MNKIFLGLGSNLGDKIENLKFALVEINLEIGRITAVSSIYETEAWGVINQDNYYNLVLAVETTILPLALIEKILKIEEKLGRKRDKKWDCRIIDIDILFYDNLIISTNNLQIPHPFIHKRNFVLEPLNEIDSSLIHPKLRKSINYLRSISEDKSWIHKLENPLK